MNDGDDDAADVDVFITVTTPSVGAFLVTYAVASTSPVETCRKVK